MTDEADDATKALPALFATIHFRSDVRPDGYSDDEITALNEKLRAKNPPTKPDSDGPA